MISKIVRRREVRLAAPLVQPARLEAASPDLRKEAWAAQLAALQHDLASVERMALGKSVQDDFGSAPR